MSAAQEPGVSFGAYRLVSRLGEGGMAEVYLAVREGPMGFRKELAIKRIKADLGSSGGARLRALINEAHLGGSLRHPNVVDTYEFGAVGTEPFIAMEYVHGLTLSALVRGAAVRGVRLPVGAILDVAQQVCNGLEYLHSIRSEAGQPLGLVHRDLKPANIIVSAAGQAKIMDFGIARYDEAVFRTATADQFRGTLLYMSPEQIADPRNLDHRSDLFTMGSILFEALTGEELIDLADPRAAMFMIANGAYRERFPLLDAVLPAARPLVDRCTRLDREERFTSAEELGNELRSLREQVGGVDARNLMRLLWAYRDGDRSYREVPGVWSQVGGDPTWSSFVEALRQDPAEDADPYRAPAPAELGTVSLPGTPGTGQPAPSQVSTSSWRRPTTGNPPRRGRGLVVAGLFALAAMGALTVGVLRPWSSADHPGEGPEPLGVATEPQLTEVATLTSTPEPGIVTPGDETPAVALPVVTDERLPEPTPVAVVEEPAVVDPTTTVPVFINTVPWSRWQLGGDATGTGAQTPYRAQLPPGTYEFTLTEPGSGASHVLSVTVTENAGPISRCWRFDIDGPC